MSKTMLLLVNPRAGKTRSRSPLFDAVARLGRSGWLVHVLETEHRGHAAQLAAQLGSRYDAVACIGGDGTLNEVIAGMMTLKDRPPLAYIPFGSTNDFACSLHIPSAPAEAAALAADGQPRALDIGSHNGRSFAYVASFGAFTRSSYAAPQSAKNALGHFAYLLEGIKDLDTLRPYHCRIEAGGEVFDGDFIFGGVCNATSLGGLVKLDPGLVRMDDGKFELLLLRMPKTPLDLQNLILALRKMHYDAPGVILRHVDAVTVTTDDDVPWALDGEYAASAPRVEIRLLPGAIRMLL